MAGDDLQALRDELGRITLEILRLVARRREVAERIGEVKERMGISLLDRSAEARLRARVLEECRRLGLGEELGVRLLNILVENSLEAQGKTGGDEFAYRRIFVKAAEMLRRGERIIRMEVGEPDFGAPQSVVEAMCQAARQGYAKYSSGQGLSELREAVASKTSEKLGVSLTQDNVVITVGGVMATYLSIEALTRPGDEVVVVEPGWPLYKPQARLHGRRVVEAVARMEDGWSPVEALREVVGDSTRLIVINYPNNPTGKVLTRGEMEEILELAERYDAWVVSDEVYMDYIYEGSPVSVLQFTYPKTVQIGSFSKAWGMTGYRIGYLITRKEEARRMAHIQNLIITNLPEFIQKAALKALEEDEVVRRNVEEMRRRLEVLCDELGRSSQIEFRKPQGAMYVFPRIKAGTDSVEFAWRLLEEKKVAVAPGASFGQGFRSYFRVSAGRPVEELREGARRIVEALEESVG